MGAGAPEARAGEGALAPCGGQRSGKCTLCTQPRASPPSSQGHFPPWVPGRAGARGVQGCRGCCRAFLGRTSHGDQDKPQVREPLLPQGFATHLRKEALTLCTDILLLYRCHQINDNPLQNLNMTQFLLSPTHFPRASQHPAETLNFSCIAMRSKRKAQFSPLQGEVTRGIGGVSCPWSRLERNRSRQFHPP